MSVATQSAVSAAQTEPPRNGGIGSWMKANAVSIVGWIGVIATLIYLGGYRLGRLEEKLDTLTHAVQRLPELERTVAKLEGAHEARKGNR